MFLQEFRLVPRPQTIKILLLLFSFLLLAQFPLPKLSFPLIILLPSLLPNGFHLLLNIFIDIVLKNIDTDPNPRVVDTGLQILDPELLDSLRIYTPDSDWFLPAGRLALVYHYLAIGFFVRVGLFAVLMGNLLDYVYEEETFLEISDLLFHGV